VCPTFSQLAHHPVHAQLPFRWLILESNEYAVAAVITRRVPDTSTHGLNATRHKQPEQGIESSGVPYTRLNCLGDSLYRSAATNNVFYALVFLTRPLHPYSNALSAPSSREHACRLRHRVCQVTTTAPTITTSGTHTRLGSRQELAQAVE
jgi:hypothetical protein